MEWQAAGVGNDEDTSSSDESGSTLKIGVTIKSRSGASWKNNEHIGAGGFGDVYKVFNENSAKTDTFYAMKTELHTARVQRLRIEAEILKEVNNYCRQHRKSKQHFCELIDAGRNQSFLWVVMTLIGPSLENVRKLMLKQFSKVTVINMSLQILEALETMHDIGFIHRDIKPQNICIGMPPNDEATLYVLDFGISRRIYKSEKSKTLRKERQKVPFFGTRKFCSRACHLEKDQGRKDDVECWLYTTLDLFHNEKGLTWNSVIRDSSKVLAKKVELFKNPKHELHATIPNEMVVIIQYLDGLKFTDSVDYKLIETQIQKIAKERNLELNTKFDWQGKIENLINEKKKRKSSSFGEAAARMAKAKRITSNEPAKKSSPIGSKRKRVDKSDDTLKSSVYQEHVSELKMQPSNAESTKGRNSYDASRQMESQKTSSKKPQNNKKKNSKTNTKTKD